MACMVSVLLEAILLRGMLCPPPVGSTGISYQGGADKVSHEKKNGQLHPKLAEKLDLAKSENRNFSQFRLSRVITSDIFPKLAKFSVRRLS